MFENGYPHRAVFPPHAGFTNHYPAIDIDTIQTSEHFLGGNTVRLFWFPQPHPAPGG
jgi:hypothetical protein